jgi:hypothetical protein
MDLSAFDQAEAVSTRDRRGTYTGEIPDAIQRLVDNAIGDGKVWFVPLSEDEQAEFSPIIAAAAALRGKSARVWTKRKDSRDATSDRLGTNVSVGERRGRPAADANGSDGGDELPTESE